VTKPIFYWIVLTLCAAYTIGRGGAPERAGMLIIGIGSIVTASVASAKAARFHTVETGIFIVDLVVLAAFVALALRANRYWPLWVAGFHLVGVTSHLAMIASAVVVPRVYAFVLALWAYPMLAIMVVGATRHRRRLAQFGEDLAWASLLSARRAGQDPARERPARNWRRTGE
jgi:hypothetical protein